MTQAGRATAAIAGRGVAKVFGHGELAVRALHPTDIAVYRGEVVVIMGPSGSGKTTLLSILGMVLTPSEGEVLIDGVPVTDATADEMAALRRDRVGLVFQQHNLLPSLGAVENVGLPLLLAGVPASERRQRAMRALSLVGMADRPDARPRSLSGGQQQRVAIARALVNDASVLLCDEPTASLDGTTGGAVLAALRSLAHDAGRAVVIVTHDDRVLAIADRVVHVIDGRVSGQDGEPVARGPVRAAGKVGVS
jgi:putative ABC transport system ATP-binding protein